MEATSKAGIGLPEAARENPYATLTREQLDVALNDIDELLAALPADAKAKRAKADTKRHQILDGYLWLLVREGKGRWSGRKPEVPKRPVKLKSGKSASDYIIEERDRLR